MVNLGRPRAWLDSRLEEPLPIRDDPVYHKALFPPNAPSTARRGCAVDGLADLLVSGDRHLLDLGEYRGIPLVAASEFLERLLEEE
jgi:hypothetical protein